VPARPREQHLSESVFAGSLSWTWNGRELATPD